MKNKGTIVRLMATRFESNRLQWELINFDSKHFSFVDVAGGGVMLDRSVVSSERSFPIYQAYLIIGIQYSYELDK